MSKNLSDLDKKIKEIKGRISELKTLIREQLKLYGIEDENLRKLQEIHLVFLKKIIRNYVNKLKILADETEGLLLNYGGIKEEGLATIQEEFGRKGIEYLDGIKRAWEEYENQVKILESKISEENKKLINVNDHIEKVTKEILEEAKIILGELSRIMEELKLKESSSLESLKKLSEKLREFQEKI